MNININFRYNLIVVEQRSLVRSQLVQDKAERVVGQQASLPGGEAGPAKVTHRPVGSASFLHPSSHSHRRTPFFIWISTLR